MKNLGMILACLFLGAFACYLSAEALIKPEDRGGGGWDLSPLVGFIYGGPIWFLSFPVIYFYSRPKVGDRSSAFIIAAVGALILTILIPFVIVRFIF